MSETSGLPPTRTGLIESIGRIVAERGIKNCTMDLVAARLSMSKRTLYEIFGSKDEMMAQVLEDFHNRQRRITEDIFGSSANIMEALVRHAHSVEQNIKQYSAEFIRDIHRNHTLEERFEQRDRMLRREISRLMQQGVREGVFRPDIDYVAALRMLRLQHETLTCMQDFYPKEVTPAQAFRSITLGFLRSIATPEGMHILDTLTKDFEGSPLRKRHETNNY